MSEGQDYIRIKSSSKRQHLTGQSSVVEYTDKSTGMICLYAPSLELHSYGDTFEEAQEMMNNSMEFFFRQLLNLSAKKIEAEFYRLGWSKKKFKQKEFVPIIDIDSRMKDEGIKDYKVSDMKIAA